VFLTLGLGVMLVSAVRASRQAVIPLWADHLMLAPSVASLIYGLAGGIDMLVFYPAGKVMDQKGRRWVAVPSMLIMGLAMLLMPLTTGTLTLLLVALAIGFGNGIGSGMIMTLGADHSPRHGRAHFPGRVAAHVRHRFLVRPGAAVVPGGQPVAGLGIAAIGLIAFAAAGALAYWIPGPAKAPKPGRATPGA
jgi:MFS family permease